MDSAGLAGVKVVAGSFGIVISRVMRESRPVAPDEDLITELRQAMRCFVHSRGSRQARH